MSRVILPVILALTGCNAPPPAPIQLAGSAHTNDPALMELFFGPGEHRGISPVIRCPVRCQPR